MPDVEFILALFKMLDGLTVEQLEEVKTRVNILLQTKKG